MTLSDDLLNSAAQAQLRYESGGGDKAPAQGWFIYGSSAKMAWATAVEGD